uniref:Kielin cysteine rich BMP regulator n=1 Tax=Chrysemys picta bellii TaxID=8478 RepID=A0A8C3P7S5_CHRPI
GKELPNGEQFPDPAEPCRICTCWEGSVSCQPRACPLLQCPFPARGPCCQGKELPNGEQFPDPAEPCRVCTCWEGSVSCQPRACPLLQCPFPARGPCCQVCEGGLGVRRGWRPGWASPGGCWAPPAGVPGLGGASAPGGCLGLSPPSSAWHWAHSVRPPTGCEYLGEGYLNGQEFLDPQDTCGRCACLRGFVTCTKTPCDPPGCRHPTSPPGKCCPVCQGCHFQGQDLADGETFPAPGGRCEQCRCLVRGRLCGERAGHSPRGCREPCTGLVPGGMEPEGSGGLAPLTAVPCPALLQQGEVSCGPLSCPGVKCPHPAVGPCDCPVCDGCSFHGRACSNGDRFPDPHDACRLCSCLVSAPCPPPKCSQLWGGPEQQTTPHGAGDGGTVLAPTASAGDAGVTPGPGPGQWAGNSHRWAGPWAQVRQFLQKHSAHWCHPGASTECQERCPCRASPSLHVSQRWPGPACGHHGGLRSQGRAAGSGGTFGPLSARLGAWLAVMPATLAPQDGSVTCVPVPCSPAPCRNPVNLPGQCCPQCSGACRYQGHLYESGTTFRPPAGDPCSTCTCLVTPRPLPGSPSDPCPDTPGSPRPPLSSSLRPLSPVCPQDEAVTCQREPCLQQCTHPVPPAAPSCCPDCNRCLFEGQELASRQAVTPPSDPCQRCRCLHGNVLCAPVLCPQVACASPVRRPGHCCPECPGCMYDGQEHANGTSWFSSPCVSCLCTHGIATCAQIRCLGSCLRPVQVPGECCPLCAGARAGAALPGPHRDGEGAQGLRGGQLLQKRGVPWPRPGCVCPCCGPVPCVCVCRGCRGPIPCVCVCDLTWVCVRQGCPQLSCPLAEQFTPQGTCCPVCDDPDGSCSYQGQQYQASEHWQVDTCTACTCVSGEVHCRSQRCPPPACAADETPALTPGMCCPHCLPRPATCLAFGDPHYRTFDGRLLHFQGTCTYVLAQDCQGGDFSIHVTNDDRGRPGVAWTKEVTVRVGDVVVQLLQDWLVRVDGQVVTLPFLKEPHLYVERQTNTVLLNTNIGVKVLWSGRSQLEVSVPGTYKGHTCGLCGDFNGHPQDDARLRSGQLARAEAAFGNSWRVSGARQGRPRSRETGPAAAGYRARKEANARCKVLKSGAFEPCHPLVPPEPFFAACVYDLCACGAGADQCLCDALEAYAALCRRAGLALRWRSPTLCAVGCPQDRGYVFDECGPPCPKTCYNKDAPLGAIESRCFTPCVPGCQCPAGRVEHESHCILPEACPQVVYGNL